jgi:hypothetical protein
VTLAEAGSILAGMFKGNGWPQTSIFAVGTDVSERSAELIVCIDQNMREAFGPEMSANLSSLQEEPSALHPLFRGRVCATNRCVVPKLLDFGHGPKVDGSSLTALLAL